MLWALALSVLAAAPDGAALETFFREFHSKRSAIESMVASYRQEIITPDGTEVLTGTLIFAKPRRIVFRYDDPSDVLIIDDQDVYEYWTEIEQVNIYSLDDEPQAEALFLGFENNLDRLARVFDIELGAADEGHCGTKVLTLRPKGEETDRPLFERVRLFLRASDHLPCEILLVNSAESQVRYRFDDFKVNRPVDADLTRLAVPEGWKIVEADMPVQTVGPEGTTLPESPVPGQKTEEVSAAEAP